MGLARCIWCFLLVLCVGITVKAQPPAPQYAYRVSFSDKKGTLSLSNPLLFLSSRAIDRRTNYGIAVDSADLPVSPAYIDSVLTLTHGELHVVSKWLNDCVILVTDSTTIHAIEGKPFITNISFIAYYASGLHKGNGINPKFSKEQPYPVSAGAYKATGTAAYYGATYGQTVLVNGDYLHDAGHKGQGMLIAIFDAGFTGTNTHPGFDSLRNAGGILDVHNFVLSTGNVYTYDSHGTAVLSTMAGNMPSSYVGTAPLAKYLLYVTEDNNSEQPIEMDNMLAATERADSMGVDIISVSLGYDLFDYNSLSYTDIDGKSTVAAKAANIATKKGILFVPSAGNDGGTSWHYVLTPGDADSALTVGAVYGDRTTISYSGHGPNSAGRVKPDVCDLGNQVSVFTSTGGLGVEDGTSFATPQIAGWAACLLSANKKATPFQIRDAIIRSADHYTTPGDQIGYGIPDFKKAADLLDVADVPVDTSAWIVCSPNPFKDQLVLKFHLAKTTTVDCSMYDILGRKVLTYSQVVNGTPNQYVILNMPQSYPTGMYILSVVAGSQRATIKLLKQ